MPLTMSAMFDSRVDTVKEADKPLTDNDLAKRFTVHMQESQPIVSNFTHQKPSKLGNIQHNEEIMDRRKAFTSTNATRKIANIETESQPGSNYVDIQVRTTTGNTFASTQKRNGGSVVNVQSMISKAQRHQQETEISNKSNLFSSQPQIPKNMAIKYRKDMQ